MIWESGPWKAELHRLAERLRRFEGRKRWTAKADFEVEQTLMLGAFIIRKLMDSAKLSNECESQAIPAIRHPRIGESLPDLLNWHHIDRFYDLSQEESCTISLRELSNQVIHSYVFAPVFLADDSGRKVVGLHGVLVASDRQRATCLYGFALKDIRAVFVDVANDDVLTSSMSRRTDGQWEGTRSRVPAMDPDELPEGLSSLIQRLSKPSGPESPET